MRRALPRRLIRWNRAALVFGLTFSCLGMVGCHSPVATDPFQSLGPEQQGEVILQAGYSGFDTSERIVVRSAEHWAAIWDKAFELQTAVPPSPAIDFSTEMVLVAALGSRPSGGYQIAITDLASGRGGLAVVVTATSPGPRCLTTAAITQPVEIIRVQAASGPVTFQDRSRINQCS